MDKNFENKILHGKMEAAFDYVLRGWKILPLGYNKVPLTTNGSHDATSDTNQIKEWFKQFGFKMNIGIATTPEFGWVVDVDMKNSKNGWQSLIDEFGDKFVFDIENNLIQQTATGGFHFVFQWPEGIDVPNGTGVLGKDSGIDIRGKGGYIVAAPSAVKINDEYAKYRWNNIDIPISQPPLWALMLLDRHTESQSAPFDVEAVMNGVKHGNRDNQLFKYAWHLKQKRLDYGLAIGFITEACKRALPPFEVSVAIEKLERAYAAETPEEKTKRLTKEIQELENELKSRKGEAI